MYVQQNQSDVDTRWQSGKRSRNVARRGLPGTLCAKMLRLPHCHHDSRWKLFRCNTSSMSEGVIYGNGASIALIHRAQTIDMVKRTKRIDGQELQPSEESGAEGNAQVRLWRVCRE